MTSIFLAATQMRFQPGYCGTSASNASSVGDGEDITATVMVKRLGGGDSSPVKVADVATGLAIKAKVGAKTGLQCAKSKVPAAVAMITIQEGYAAGIMTGVRGVTCGSRK